MKKQFSAFLIAVSLVGAGLSFEARAQSEASALSAVSALPVASVVVGASIELAGQGVASAAVGVGTLVTVSVIGAGVVLSVAGEAMAFLPNELGRALMHNERLTK